MKIEINYSWNRGDVSERVCDVICNKIDITRDMLNTLVLETSKLAEDVRANLLQINNEHYKQSFANN